MRVAAYCRVSTDKEDQLNSLENQKNFFTEYTDKHNYTLVGLYADEGISGTSIKNRKEFLRLMNDANEKKFEMVVVKDISRFARNTVDFLQSIRKLKSLNIETVFLTSSQTVLGSSEFVLTIFSALAQEESANTSKRIKWGKKENAKKGRVPNIVYGYDKTSGDYFNLSVNEKEADIVKQIFDWYTEEGYGANKISAMLNDRGIKTKRMCNWTQNAIIRILKNEIYIGNIINGKSEIEDFLTGVRKEFEKEKWMVVHRPEYEIISKRQYEKAQTILGKRAVVLGKEKQSNKYLFSTLIKCSECHRSFRRIQRKYKNSYIRWVCSSRNQFGSECCCNSTVIDEKWLIDEIKLYLKEIINSKDNFRDLIIKEFSKGKAVLINSNLEVKEAQKEIKLLEKKRSKFIEMFADGIIIKEELKLNITSINYKIDLLKKEINRNKINLLTQDKIEKIINQKFPSVEELIELKDLTNTQIRNIIKSINVFPDGKIDIHFNLLSCSKLTDENIPLCNIST